MNLNYIKLIELIEAGLFDFSICKEILTNPNSFKNFRGRDNFGVKWGFWDDVVDKFSTLEIDLSVLIEENVKNKDFLINLANFWPDIFCEKYQNFQSVVESFSYHDSSLILHIEKVFDFLVDFYNKEKIEKYPPMCFFTTLQMLSFLRKRELILYQKIDFTGTSKDFISALSKLNFVKIEKPTKKLKVALFVSGEVRSPLNHFYKINQLLSSFDVDLYFSSWVLKGGLNITPAHLSRYFTHQAVDLIKSRISSIDDFDLSYFSQELSAKAGYLTTDEVAKEFNFCKFKYINIDDGSQSPFDKLTNPGKMYYNNSVWVKKQGVDHFNQYDYVIKLRPDIDVVSLDVDELFNAVGENGFVTEEHCDWIFRYWGLGVGDQFIAGRPSVLIPLLNIFNWEETDVSSQLMKNTFGLTPYKGHVNLAIKAIFQNSIPLGNRFLKISYSSYEKFGVDDLLSYFEGRK